MATLYLHLGLPKTGTTAIQNFLGKNTEALSRHSICFPDFGLRFLNVGIYRNAFFLTRILWRVRRDKETATMRDTFQSVLQQLSELGRQYDTIILSDESLWRFSCSYPKFWTDLRDVLAQNGLQLRIIVYLRRQDNLMLSFYRQKVNSVRTDLSFYDYMDTAMKDYPMDYLPSLNMLSEYIGRENIILRVYEPGQFRGAEHSLLSDFLDIFGLSVTEEFDVTDKLYNPTLDGPYLEIRRILNSLPGAANNADALRKSFKTILNNPDMEKPEKTTLFRPGEQSAYLERFAESNARIAREFLHREDGRLFYDESGTDLPEYSVDTNALLRDTILFYGQTVQLLEKEIAALREELDTLKASADAQENSLFSRTQRKLRHLISHDYN